MNHKSQTRLNWSALKSISQLHFEELRAAHPLWTLDVLLRKLSLPRTALMLELATASGFKSETEPNGDEVCAVLSFYASGVRFPEIISKETKINIQKVCRVLDMRSAGYGSAPFGHSLYGSHRAVSDGTASVCRRTTIKGQLSYRGRRYSLGAIYRGRTVFVRETRDELLVTCNDRSPLYLSRYPIR